jgi:hypothetical protein
MEETTLKEEEESLSEAISPRSVQLSRHVRQLALALRDKTATTPYAADTLVLANEVGNLCDYVEQLHGNVQTLLSKIDAAATSASTTAEENLTPEDKKAMEIQREVHELHPTVMDTVKALFMWRDSPDQRLRDDK